MLIKTTQEPGLATAPRSCPQAADPLSEFLERGLVALKGSSREHCGQILT